MLTVLSLNGGVPLSSPASESHGLWSHLRYKLYYFDKCLLLSS